MWVTTNACWSLLLLRMAYGLIRFLRVINFWQWDVFFINEIITWKLLLGFTQIIFVYITIYFMTWEQERMCTFSQSMIILLIQPWSFSSNLAACVIHFQFFVVFFFRTSKDFLQIHSTVKIQHIITVKAFPFWKQSPSCVPRNCDW